jgi:two-component system LytT family response regulator
MAMETQSRKIRAIVVDDEPLARRGVRALLARDDDVEIVGECGGGSEAVRLMRELAPDLVFLDVQMPGLDGFGVLSEAQIDPMPVVVFVTAYDKYAVRAFEVHALDYLLKPFDRARFAEAVGRAKARIKNREVIDLSRRLASLLEAGRGGEGRAADAHPEAERKYLTRLFIKSSDRAFFVRAEEIDWIEAADYYVKVHAGGKAHLLRETMNDLAARLDPEKFMRIHRASIVNIDRIKELQQHFDGGYVAVLRDGTQLKMSRRRRENLSAMLDSARR